MNASCEVSALLGSVFPNIKSNGDAIRIETHCLYADGQGVAVTLFRRSPDVWVATDAGEGWNVLRDHLLNPSPRSAARRADAIKRNMGVSYQGGEWEVECRSLNQIIGSVLLIANASQAWVEKMISAEAVHGRAEVVEEKLQNMLREVFGERRVERETKIKGLNKVYDVSTIVALKNNKFAAFEVVTPFPTSIYPAYTKFSDISHSKSKPVYMAVALEGMDRLWKSDDLALLRSSGAALVDVDYGLPSEIMHLA